MSGYYLLAAMFLLTGGKMVIDPEGFAGLRQILSNARRDFNQAFQPGALWKQRWEIDAGLSPAQRTRLRIVGFGFIAWSMIIIGLSAIG